ncbi:MAG: DNA polymerase III subunit gamma/tau, partial [Polaribacter sp.]|nr:DNA polymerase III subunit gamma/tau [Polaribacter sp.]
KKEVILDENFDNHPKNDFTQKELEKTWKLYHTELIKRGQKSIAATFNADLPVLKENFEIILTLPNTLMQGQIEKERPNLLKHLRTTLNNYGITVSILVNETVTKKFAYTPQEKYDKLLEKNPAMALLKEVFKLGL